MLNSAIRILNFDDSLDLQKTLLKQYTPEIVNLRDLGPRARLWLDKETKSQIIERLANSGKNSVTFLGSGDFHQVSNILISQFSEPLSVIVFDTHPDWDSLPPRLGCGSWVTETLKCENILKFILIGVSSDDISSFNLETADLNSLSNNRLEIYPYAHRPSLVFLKRIPRNISIQVKKWLFINKIFWSELRGKNLSEFILSLVKRIPTKKVYLSIDKDCLKSEFALTNWEEGLISLEELILMLKVIQENCDIIGADISGDYSPVIIRGRFKKFCSAFDHPKKVKAKDFSQNLISQINEETNLKILEVLNR